MTWNPKKRLTACEALDHAYLEDFRLDECEPEADPISVLEFEFE